MYALVGGRFLIPNTNQRLIPSFFKNDFTIAPVRNVRRVSRDPTGPFDTRKSRTNTAPEQERRRSNKTTRHSRCLRIWMGASKIEIAHQPNQADQSREQITPKHQTGKYRPRKAPSEVFRRLRNDYRRIKRPHFAAMMALA